MRIGVVTEVKNNENRVAATPAGVHELVGRGHRVRVQAGAGSGSSFEDETYARAGGEITDSASEVWDWAELVLKVKEPVSSEYGHLREGLTLFTYLHLAADEDLTRALLSSGATAIAYETVQRPDGSLPLLAPMSEVAGRLATQVGAHHLMRPYRGRGQLLGGVPGSPRGRVLIIGGGVAGEQAATIAVGMQAEVTILDLSLPRLRELDARFGTRISTARSSPYVIAEQVREADLVIGAALVPGAHAPTLVTDAMVATMRPGSVLVDIAIDQGGCFEGSRPTTHDDPVFAVHECLYYCVANMPGAVPVTSTIALTNATLPYVAAIADAGWGEAVREDPALAAGVNVSGGRLVNAAVGQAHDLPAAPL
ncbi:alanine dehydrogenase [Ruania suaedae]|uniref:alanine dehydrogenase n=1 Tax=Ruania suaedae TaxID=2897774 RepID=UPI001E4417A0|nr:alanine dehydrogenase [Ruania suaedae]UFU03333.1 alanine dehydrogenase [Ruania suaedae]